MSRTGGRIFNRIGRTPFEVKLFATGWRLSWVTFFGIFPLILLGFTAITLVGPIIGIIFSLILTWGWFKVVKLLNRADEEHYLNEATTLRGQMSAWTHRDAHPELPKAQRG